MTLLCGGKDIMKRCGHTGHCGCSGIQLSPETRNDWSREIVQCASAVFVAVVVVAVVLVAVVLVAVVLVAVSAAVVVEVVAGVEVEAVAGEP